MYTAYYGFHEKPFSLTPDPRYLFLGESHREALGHLLYGIEQGEGFIAVTGEVGTGKTTLCRTLVHRLGADVEVAFLFNPNLSPIELLQAICDEFGLKTAGASARELGAALNAFLLEKRHEGRRVLILIDEAQNLADETLEQLRLLSNLETEASKLVQIVLLGQPELDEKLESEGLRQLRQRISLRWRLGPLTSDETRAYVRHRLRIAAGGDCDRFSEGALRLVHRLSGGTPRVINILCDRALLAGYAASRPRIERPLVASVAAELRLGARGARRTRRGLRAAAVVLPALAALALVVAWNLRSEAPQPEAGETARAPGRAPDASSPGFLASGDEPPTFSTELPPTSAPPQAVAPTAPPSSHASSLAAALEAWGLAPGAAAEAHTWGDVLGALESAGLEILEIPGASAALLRRLDLPALVRLEQAGGARRTAWMVAADDRAVTLVGAAPDGPVWIGWDELERSWTGDAWVAWRDFERLPALVAPGQRGAAVAWVQTALGALGYYRGPADGVFDEGTAVAVRAFQRAAGLAPDAAVGPRTKILLYASLGSYPAPRLAGDVAAVGSPAVRRAPTELSESP